MPPDLSVLSPSPLKMVVPTKAGVVPTRARSAYTTVPRDDEGAAHTGAVTSEKETNRARILFAIEWQGLRPATLQHSLLLPTARLSFLQGTATRATRRACYQGPPR